MALIRRTYDSWDEAEREALRLLCAASERAVVPPALLVPTGEAVLRCKRSLAGQGAGFGVTVSTPARWLADVWETFGDGRALVGALDRRLLMRAAFAQAASRGDFPLGQTSGVLRLAVEVAREGFSRARVAAGMGEAERCLAGVLDRYGALLRERGLAEPTEACDLLREGGMLTGRFLAVLDCDTVRVEDELFDALEGVRLSVPLARACDAPRHPELEALSASLFHPDFQHPVKPAGRVRFAFPAGRYAAAPLLVDAAASYLEDHPGARVAFAAADAPRLFFDVAPRLAARGISTGVSARVPFCGTAFGAAWRALAGFALEGGEARPAVAQASDFALSPFSAMDVAQAQRCDSRFRRWRGQTVDEALTDLTAFADEDYRDMAALVAEGDFAGALDAQARFIAAQDAWPAAYRSQQLAAALRAREVHARAAAWGLSPAQALDVLEEESLPLSWRFDADPPEGACVEGSLPDGCGAAVIVMGMDRLSALPAASCDAVFLCDLEACSYPLRDEEGPKELLFRRWGILQPSSALARARRMFSRAVAVASQQLVAERRLGTSDADGERPAALFEELVDCYRCDPQNPDEVDPATGLPEALAPFSRLRGEERVGENLSLTGEPPRIAARVPVHPTGHVGSAARGLILPPRILEGGAVDDRPHLSPSAIESYLECPYQWFARRRLRLESPDADFGGIAFGNFAHGVLESLHAALRERGLRRVTADNADQALALLDALFDARLESERYRIAPDALLPLDELERRDVEELRRHLRSFVEREALLLPDFEPWAHEAAFGEGARPFEYAGVLINGKIDRVDVDAFGRAAVIDYKGSAGRPYAFRVKGAQEFALPRKMQALIYAQAVRRVFGLIPVAAVYVSYGKKPAIRGLYDRTVLDAERDLWGIDPGTCGTDAFCEMLDRAEEAVAGRLEHLLAGEIPAMPSDEEACRYCPVGICSTRDDLRREGEGR